MTEQDYRQAFNLDERIPIAKDGDTIQVSHPAGDVPLSNYLVVAAADGPPVPQKCAGTTTVDIGTGNLPEPWILDMDGNAIALPVGSTLRKDGDEGDAVLAVFDFGLMQGSATSEPTE